MLYMMETLRLVPSKIEAFKKFAESAQLPLFEELGYRLVAYWETSPLQGYWPEAVALWEMDDFGHYGQICAKEYGDGAIGRTARDMRRRLGEFVTAGDSRIMSPSPSSKTPTLAEIKRSGRRIPMCVIEQVHTVPGKSLEYITQLEKIWTPVAEKAGRWMVGTYASGWRHREAINIWAAEEWATVPPGVFRTDVDELASDAHTWVEMGLALRDEWDDRVMIALPFSPTA